MSQRMPTRISRTAIALIVSKKSKRDRVRGCLSVFSGIGHPEIVLVIVLVLEAVPCRHSVRFYDPQRLSNNLFLLDSIQFIAPVI